MRDRMQDYYLVAGVEHRSVEQPGAGAELVVTVPSGEVWTPLALTFIYTADANAADRRVNLTYDNQDETFARVITGTNIVASTARTVSLIAENAADAEDAVSGVIQGRLPAFPLLPGYRIRTVTTGRQVGDQITVPALFVAVNELEAIAEQAAYHFARYVREAGGLTIAPGVVTD